MLSSRTRYATRAILDLSVRYGVGPVAMEDIACRQDIPLKYLQQILLALKLAGFVQSRKGRAGGYSLSRPPGEISLGEVVRAMEGPIAPVSCVSVSSYADCGCPHPETCSLRTVFKGARDAISDVLDGTSFQEIVCKQRELDTLPAHNFDYQI